MVLRKVSVLILLWMFSSISLVAKRQAKNGVQMDTL